MEWLRRLGQQVRQIWQGMPLARQVGVVAVVAVALVVLAVIFYYGTQPLYRPLYTNLTLEEAAAVKTKLDSLSQTFDATTSNGLTTIRVPEKDVDRLRIDLAGEGLPVKGAKGFELFDSPSLSETPFEQQVKYLRSLQGELGKTIEKVDGVVAARVHIVQAVPSPFVREQKPAKASVILKLRPGAALSRQQAANIAALVANAVEGLEIQNVALLDTAGRRLVEVPHAETGAVATQLEYQRQLEKDLAEQAEGLLAAHLGPGRVRVTVNAVVDFSHKKERKETYDPEARVATREHTMTSKSNTPAAQPRGPAGAVANLGRGGGTPGPSGDAKQQQDESTTEYAVSRVTQEFEEKKGTIQRLSVAALVDLSQPEGATPAQGKALTQQDVEDIIKQAVGFTAARGDQIKVSDVRMSGLAVQGPSTEEVEQRQQREFILNLVRNGALGLASLITLILGWLLLRRLFPPPVPPPPPPPPPPVGERQRLRERLGAAVQTNPEALARLLAALLERAEEARRAAPAPRT